MKTRLLFFIDYFLPGYRAGGPVSSIANLVKLLDGNLDVVIVTRNHDFGSTESYNLESDKVIRYENFNVIYLSEINSSSIRKTIEDMQPDVIYLNSFFSKFSRIVLSLAFLKKISTTIIVAPRGELQQNALAIKKFKKSLYLRAFKIFGIDKLIEFHSTDPIESVELETQFKKAPLATIPNVPKLIEPYLTIKSVHELKLIFLSRISYKKNLAFALEMLSSISDKEIIFDIYGPIEDDVYWQQCQKIINRMPSGIKITYKGMIAPDQISTVMKNYHAFFLPTLSENYGHVIVEAMQAGVVPIISNQTPWINLSEQKAGWDVDLHDKESFVHAISALYYMDNEEYSIYSKSAVEYINNRLNFDNLKQQYTDFFNHANKIHGKENNV